MRSHFVPLFSLREGLDVGAVVMTARWAVRAAKDRARSSRENRVFLPGADRTLAFGSPTARKYSRLARG